MSDVLIVITKWCFDRQFKAFKSFVEDKSGAPFRSFRQHVYTRDQEGYKSRLHRHARDILDFPRWKKADIGSGKIARAIIKAIEHKDNNLVQWQPRYGASFVPHRKLRAVLEHRSGLPACERVFYSLFCGDSDRETFNEMIGLFGKRFGLLAYLFFLKDKSRYMPIAPRYFDRAFQKLGAHFRTSHRCSWESYTQYNELLYQIRDHLSNCLNSTVSLLDAHSFAWILASQMEKEEEAAKEVPFYRDFGEAPNDDPAELAEFAKRVRQGQSAFRKNLLRLYDEKCAVTGSGPSDVLEATHIWPHAESGINRSDNGLLLRADIHHLFDADLLRIHPKTLQVQLDKSLRGTEYWGFDGRPLRPRRDGRLPNREYLRSRWKHHVK